VLPTRPGGMPVDQCCNLVTREARRGDDFEPANGLYLQARVACPPRDAQAPVQFEVARTIVIRHVDSLKPRHDFDFRGLYVIRVPLDDEYVSGQELDLSEWVAAAHAVTA